MTINTLHNIGDKIADKNGLEKTVLGVHVWKSENTQTERYWFGKAKWRTIKRDMVAEKEKINNNH